MWLAKCVNCVCFNYRCWILLDPHTHTHTHTSNLSDSSCLLTLSDCTFEYVTEECQKAEVTPRDQILVQEWYLSYKHDDIAGICANKQH